MEVSKTAEVLVKDRTLVQWPGWSDSTTDRFQRQIYLTVGLLKDTSQFSFFSLLSYNHTVTHTSHRLTHIYSYLSYTIMLSSFSHYSCCGCEDSLKGFLL